MTDPLRFVIQEHARPDDTHWDLMLQQDPAEDLKLSTWCLPVAPGDLGDKPVTATKIADHDPKFLTYQGPVNNNTAKVQIADHGTYTLLTQTESQLTLNFHGEILRGPHTLTQLHCETWQLKRSP